MRLEGEAYSERLESFSDSTLELIADLMGYTMKIHIQMSDITTNSELSEEEVVEKLLELKAFAERQKNP